MLSISYQFTLFSQSIRQSIKDYRAHFIVFLIFSLLNHTWAIGCFHASWTTNPLLRLTLWILTFLIGTYFCAGFIYACIKSKTSSQLSLKDFFLPFNRNVFLRFGSALFLILLITIGISLIIAWMSAFLGGLLFFWIKGPLPKVQITAFFNSLFLKKVVYKSIFLLIFYLFQFALIILLQEPIAVTASIKKSWRLTKQIALAFLVFYAPYSIIISLSEYFLLSQTLFIKIILKALLDPLLTFISINLYFKLSTPSPKEL